MADAMESLCAFLCVAERDIGHLLLEEMNVCSGHSSWLLSHTATGHEKTPGRDHMERGLGATPRK